MNYRHVATICCVLIIQSSSLYSPVTATNTLAEAYRAEASRLYQQGRLADANSLYEKAFKETDPAVGGEKITLEQAAILSEWGQTESKLAEECDQTGGQDVGNSQTIRDLAITHLQDAVQYQEEKLGANSATCAKTLDTLASVHLASEHYTLAESIFRKALSIRETNFGTGSPEIGYELWKLAVITLNSRRYPETVQLCNRALPLLVRAYGSNNTADMQCKLTLADALYQMNRLQEAEPRAQECLSYWKRKKGNEYSLTRESQQLIDNIEGKRADAAQHVLRKQLGKFSPGDPRLIPYIEAWGSASKRAGRQDDADRAQKWLVGMITTVKSNSSRAAGVKK